MAPLLIGLVVAVIIASAGGFFIWQKLAAHGGQPESAVPATAVAYAEVDLDPSADQKLKLRDQLRKIPGVKAKVSATGTDLKEELLKSALGNVPIVDYDSDVKPWLGDRIAVAVIPGTTNEPEPIILLQHKDKAKAETAMRKLFGALSMDKRSGPGSTSSDDSMDLSIDSGSSSPKAYAVGNEYIVMGSSQSVVDAAVAAAAAVNLSSAKNYTADVATLGAGQVVTGWADLGALYALAGAQAAAMSPMFGGLQGAENSGRYVVGVHAFDDGFEMTGRVIGNNVMSGDIAGRPASPLTSLPSNTAAALYLGNPGRLVTAAFNALKTSIPAADLKVATDKAAEMGITIPGDVGDLLGTDAVAGLAPVDTSQDGSPQGGVRLTPKDAQHSLDLLRKVAGQTPDQSDLLDAVKVEGKDLVWTTPVPTATRSPRARAASVTRTTSRRR